MRTETERIIKEIKLRRLLLKWKNHSEKMAGLKTLSIKDQRYEDAARFRDLEKTTLNEIDKIEKLIEIKTSFQDILEDEIKLKKKLGLI